MPVLGDIAKKARERMPNTWDALAAGRLGENGLRGRVDSVKMRLFGVVIDPSLEPSTYGAMGTDYAGIVSALAIIPAGYDHWTVAPTSWGAVGRNENKTFLDRAEKLLQLRDALVEEEMELYPYVIELLTGTLRPTRRGVMTGRTATTIVTPDAKTFAPAYELPVVII